MQAVIVYLSITAKTETYLLRFLFDWRPQQEGEVEWCRKINNNK